MISRQQWPRCVVWVGPNWPPILSSLGSKVHAPAKDRVHAVGGCCRLSSVGKQGSSSKLTRVVMVLGLFMQALFDLEATNNELKADLRDLYITSAKEVDAGSRKAIIVHVSSTEWWWWCSSSGGV